VPKIVPLIKILYDELLPQLTTTTIIIIIKIILLLNLNKRII